MREVKAEIIEHKPVGGNYYLLKLKGDFPPSLPGQFLMLLLNSSFDPFLRRPFAIMDQEDDEISIFYAVVGRGTALLSDKKKGDTLRVITPLGKGFRIVKGKAALFAGGRGAAPLYYLARKLENPVVFYAGKTAADLPLAPLFEKVTSQLHLITEDGSVGKKGLITDFIPETDFDMVYVVGPEEMMRKFAEIYRNRKTPVEFSFERRMGCGFGVCFGCAVKVVRDGQEIYVRACKEGPVFSLQEVVWT